MNLNGDNCLNGSFIIKKGQGISQAIAGELGLKEDDCKKLGTIWDKIIKIAENTASYTEDSKKFEKGMVLQEGDRFEFKQAEFDKIIKLVNDKLNKNIQYLSKNSERVEDAETTKNNPTKVEKEKRTDDTTTTADDETAIGEEAVVASETTDKEEATVNEDILPSVLLRNSAFISTGLLYKAIKDPAFRKEFLPNLNKLTKEEKAAFDKACKKYDDAKAQKIKLKKEIQSGKKSAKSGKADLANLKKAEQELTNAQKEFNSAQDAVKAEETVLKKNQKYTTLKNEYKNVQQEIQKLETQKLKNKTKRLSPSNEEKLTKLKLRKAEILKEKQQFEAKLKDLKKKRDLANKRLKQSQYSAKAEAADTKIQDAQSKVKAEEAALKGNKEYTNAIKTKQALSKKINALEGKASRSHAEEVELKNLKNQRSKLDAKIAKLRKPLLDSKAQVKKAQGEKALLEKVANKDPNAARKALLSKVKKGKNKIRINLKKLPKASVNVLRGQFTKMQGAAKVGSKMLKGAGKVAKPLAVILSAVDIYNAYQTGGTKKAVRQTAKIGAAMTGAWAGAKGGAALGATVGSVVPGIGTAVGGFVGGVVGGFAGWWVGEKTYDTVESAVLPTETEEGYAQAQQGSVTIEMNQAETEALINTGAIPPEAIEWVE